MNHSPLSKTRKSRHHITPYTSRKSLWRGDIPSYYTKNTSRSLSFRKMRCDYLCSKNRDIPRFSLEKIESFLKFCCNLFFAFIITVLV